MWLLYRKLKIQKLPSGYFVSPYTIRQPLKTAHFGGSLVASSAACFLLVLPAPSGWVPLCSLSGIGDGSVGEDSKAMPALSSACDHYQTLLSVFAHAAIKVSFSFFETSRKSLLVQSDPHSLHTQPFDCFMYFMRADIASLRKAGKEMVSMSSHLILLLLLLVLPPLLLMLLLVKSLTQGSCLPRLIFLKNAGYTIDI